MDLVYLLLVGVPVIAAMMAVFMRIVPPIGVVTLVKVTRGNMSVVKGTLRPFAYDHLKTMLADARVGSGFVAIRRDRRVIFSRSIPANIHQRIRNVVLNQ